jgi:DNA-binding CsgD family transcriptional regulator
MERLLTSAEALADLGSWSLDLRSGEAMWSEGMYRIHGFAPGSVEPCVDLLLEHTHADDRPRLEALLAEVVETPERVSEEGIRAHYRAIRADGSVRDVRFHGRIECEHGAPARWVGAAQDVTEQRLTERELHAHYALNQALREWGSMEDGLIALLRRLGTALGFDFGALFTADPSQERLVCRAFWSASEADDAAAFATATRCATFRAGQGVPGSVWGTPDPVVVDDLTGRLDAGRRGPAQRLGLRSAVAIPAVDRGETIAVLAFYGADHFGRSESLLRTLAVLGGEIGRFLGRRRAELEPRRLTDRELEVLALAAEGFSGPRIAERLFVSPATVKTHFDHIYEKLGVGDRAAAVAHALRTGLLR